MSRILRVRTRLVSHRIPLRSLAVTACLLVVSLTMALLCLSVGEYPIPLAEAAAALIGQGPDFTRLVIVEWRAPIAFAALVFGLLLGLSGALFQSLTRNPLGSPDVIGFDAGSYTAVVVLIIIFDTADYMSMAAAGILGGLLTALIVYLLAYRGGMQGFRLIVVGIGISAILGSANAYLITRAKIEDAMSVGFWAAGSLARITWSGLVPAVCVAVVMIVLAAGLERHLRRLELGDDIAAALGVRVQGTRLLAVVVGTFCVAVVTAAAGPISFVALVAPQLAARLTRTSGVDLLPAAMMGAAVLSAAQLLSQLASQQFRPVPVGLLTVSLGGLYLIWLIVREVRRGSRC